MDSNCISVSKFNCASASCASWNGLPAIKISNSLCDATVSLNGGHVCEFVPKGRKPLLWISKASNFAPGKPIRGGVPVCWPWFGGAVQQPAHGFARISLWGLESLKDESDGSTTLSLKLESSESTLALWPHKFKAVITLKAGAKLDLALEVFNTGCEPFRYTGALHTYVPVSKITDVKVRGLEGASFINSLDGSTHVQEGSVEFGFELDRLYFPTVSDCIVEDSGWGRKLRVKREGSRSAVVWNPWIEKSKRMPDFGDEEYWGMLCVEAANAGGDSVEVAPGASHSLRTIVEEIQ